MFKVKKSVLLSVFSWVMWTIVFSGQTHAAKFNSFGAINLTDKAMDLVSVTGTGSIVVDDCPFLPIDMPPTTFPEPSVTGCSGNIDNNAGSVHYVVKVIDTHDEYEVTVRWYPATEGGDRKGRVIHFACRSSSCSVPVNHFQVYALYDSFQCSTSFNEYNVVIEDTNY